MHDVISHMIFFFLLFSVGLLDVWYFFWHVSLLLCKGTHYDFDESNSDDADEDWSSSGDVKYHLGTSMDRTYPDGRRCPAVCDTRAALLCFVHRTVPCRAVGRLPYFDDGLD